MTKFPTLCVLSAALLMVACVSQQKYDVSQQRNAELEAQYKQLNETMRSEIAARELRISRMQDAIKVSVNDDLLFPSGGSEMSADAKTSIAKIAAILAPHQKDKINVNGYTDSTPIGPELASRPLGNPRALLLLVGFVAIWLATVMALGALRAWVSTWWSLELGREIPEPRREAQEAHP